MKKTILAMLIVVTSTAVNAAQINWGLTGPIQYNGTSVAQNATLQLVCLDGITTDWSDYALNVASGKTSEGVVATKETNASGVSVATVSPYGFSWAAEGGSTSIADSIIAKGTDFAVLVTTVQDEKTYYWASDVYNVTDSGSNWNGTRTTYTMSQTAASGPNNNWKAVPEPSTAALALAGLALLLKRRKA